MHKSKTIEKLQTLITDLVAFLETHHFVQVCAYSGQESPVGLYQLGDSIFLINEESYQLLKSNLQIEVDSYQNQKENVLLGAVGALLGALIGWSSCSIYRTSRLCSYGSGYRSRDLYH